MSKWDSAEEFKEFIAENKISNVRVANLFGIHRDTVQKWLSKDRVPVGVLDSLRGMDLKTYTFKRDFALALEFAGATDEDFCALVGVSVSTIKTWKSDGFVPKWAVTILKQKRAIKLLREGKAKVERELEIALRKINDSD